MPYGSGKITDFRDTMLDNRHAVLQILADGRLHSGQTLGTTLGLSRAAVWKIVASLRNHWGLRIQAIRGRGYRLASPVPLLDPQRIRARLNAPCRGRLRDVTVRWSVDSTNRQLLQRAQQEDIHGHLLLAEQQIAGRGRLGRQWHSPPAANLYFSLGWVFPPGTDLNGLSLAVAVALWRALSALGVRGHGIKWPNDLWWQERKLAGILIEMRSEAEGPWQVVIGVGLNVAMSRLVSVDIDQPWIDLAGILGTAPDRNRVTATLLDTLLPALEGHQQQGLAACRDDWQAADLLQGRPVELQTGERRLRGIARGIDAQGALLLETGEGLLACHAGDVRLRPLDG